MLNTGQITLSVLLFGGALAVIWVPGGTSWRAGSTSLGFRSMALYVVLRHRRAAEQTYQNVWQDDRRIEIIETPAEIGDLCARAKERGERVFVHRCGWEEIPPAPLLGPD